jgi:hypothetical protein
MSRRAPRAGDEDLEGMLDELDLSVARTAVSRHDEGGVEDRPARGVQETSSPWESVHAPSGSRGRSGTSDHRSTMYGNAETVRSGNDDNSVRSFGLEFGDEIPRAVSVRSASRSIKKHKLYKVPDLGSGYEESCFRLIGQGQTFCTARNCTTTHQGAVYGVRPGWLFVSKAHTAAFSDPGISKQQLTAELLVEWDVKSAGLTEWTRLFLLASQLKEDGPASAAAMEAQDDFAQRAEAFRTPSRVKRKAVDEGKSPIVLHVSPYKRQFTKTDADGKPEMASDDEVFEKLLNLDHGLEHTSRSVVDLYADYGEHAKESNLATRSLEHKLEKTTKELGSRPKALSSDYDTPTAWGSIGALGQKLDQVAKANNSGKWSYELAQSIEGVKLLVPTLVDIHTSSLDVRLDKIKDFALRSVKKLNDRITSEADAWMYNAGSTVPAAAPPVSAASTSPDWADTFVKTFEKRLDDVSVRLAKVTSETDEQAIRFAGLGFRSLRESEAWLAIHLPEHQCGLIVDVHIVMEHVHASIGGQEVIGQLQKQIKLGILTLADGLAMSSFQSKLPRFLSKQGAHTVIKNDTSFFSEVPTWEEWDMPMTGFRECMKEALTSFRTAHQGNIDDTLERGALVYSISTMALTESVAWLEGFINFIDDYYRDLSAAKFGSRKAWHVTTRLGRRMFLELDAPRNGVQNFFKAGFNDQVCQRIFWSVVRSHDVMSRYKRNNYKDDPSVSSELVKFLAINTGFEVLEKLTVKVTEMERVVLAMQKETAAATKSAMSAANRADDAKKLCDALIKRVTKLEK